MKQGVQVSLTRVLILPAVFGAGLIGCQVASPGSSCDLLDANCSPFLTALQFSLNSSSASAASATIQNARDGSVLQSGFLIGSASGVSAVQLSLDGAAYQTASGTTTWSLPLPTGSETWKNDSVHTVDVRAVSVAGVTGTSTRISVTRGPNNDVNGDGYPDLVISAYLADRVFVIHGRAEGVAAGSVASQAATVLSGQVAADNFGVSLAVDDVNVDGYADVLVGAPQHDAGGGANQGAAYVFLGRAGGIASGGATTASVRFSGEIGGNQFGKSLALGDVDGDGDADVLVGAPEYNTGFASAGRLYLFRSPGAALVPSATFIAGSSAEQRVNGSVTNERVGTVLFARDVTGDGKADLLAGAPGQDRVYLATSVGTVGGIVPVTAAAAYFSGTGLGVSVAAGDLDRDGRVDIIVGAPSHSTPAVNAGAAAVFYGSATAFSGAQAIAGKPVITGTLADHLNGQVLTTADLNADGFADLLLGAPGGPAGFGRVAIFSGGTTRLTSGTIVSANVLLNSSTAGEQFGGSLLPLDWNGDGHLDLLAGAWGAATQTGACYAYAGSATGITPATSPLVVSGSQAGGQLCFRAR